MIRSRLSAALLSLLLAAGCGDDALDTSPIDAASGDVSGADVNGGDGLPLDDDASTSDSWVADADGLADDVAAPDTSADAGSDTSPPDTWAGPTPGPAPTTAPAGFDYYADLYNTLGHTDRLRVRGRLVHEDEPVDKTTTTPLKEISQDEAKGEPFTVWLDGVWIADLSTDAEGYVDARVNIAGLGFLPGLHTLSVRVDNVEAGDADATLLATDHSDIVVRSDIDQTYLDTDFSLGGLAGLMLDDAGDRDALPGMAAVYQQLDRPTVFLSGSPKFFKRILEGKMTLDGVANAGLVLKPFKDLIAENLADLDLGAILPSLTEQVGYKLTRLFQLRQDLPASTPEILLGDDSEADHVAYALYHRVTSGELSVEALLTILDGFGVSATWRAEVASEAPAALAALSGHPAGGPVRAIYIRQTPEPGADYPVSDWTIDGLTVHHADSTALLLDLEARGFVVPTP